MEKSNGKKITYAVVKKLICAPKAGIGCSADKELAVGIFFFKFGDDSSAGVDFAQTYGVKPNAFCEAGAELYQNGATAAAVAILGYSL